MSGSNGAAGLRTRHVVQMVANALYDRMRTRGRDSDPHRTRDVEADCGHPKEYSAEQFAELISRNGYANKANSILPTWTWSVHPQVYEVEDEDTVTPFEAALGSLNSQLAPDSKLAMESCGLVWPWLEEADRLSRVGRYGVLLIGTDDGLKLSQEPPKRRKGAKLTYLRAFSECDAKISEFDKDETSPRYCQPTQYQVTFRSPEGDEDGDSHLVHWRRVVHVNSGTGPVYSEPFLRPILPNLLDLRKTLGADAEGYWQWGFPLFTWETPPEFGGEIDVDDDSIRDELEKVFGGLKRWILSRGATGRTLSPELGDPTPHVMAQLQPVCAYLSCPLRIFLGSERGELASGQDARQWHATLRDHRHNHSTPAHVGPAIDRFIWLGVLPEPERFHASWPDSEVQTGEEKARVAQMRTQALAGYANSEAPRFVGPADYLTQWQGFTAAEAAAMTRSGAAWAAANPAPAPVERPPTERQGAAGENPGGNNAGVSN